VFCLPPPPGILQEHTFAGVISHVGLLLSNLGASCRACQLARCFPSSLLVPPLPPSPSLFPCAGEQSTAGTPCLVRQALLLLLPWMLLRLPPHPASHPPVQFPHPTFPVPMCRRAKHGWIPFWGMPAQLLLLRLLLQLPPHPASHPLFNPPVSPSLFPCTGEQSTAGTPCLGRPALLLLLLPWLLLVTRLRSSRPRADMQWPRWVVDG
jgi:hypothetical protein